MRFDLMESIELDVLIFGVRHRVPVELDHNTPAKSVAVYAQEKMDYIREHNTNTAEFLAAYVNGMMVYEGGIDKRFTSIWQRNPHKNNPKAY